MCSYIHVMHGPKLFVTMSALSISVTGVHDSDEGHEATMDTKVFQIRQVIL